MLVVGERVAELFTAAGDEIERLNYAFSVDLRDAAQRDADALVELARRALDGGELPTEGGERPRVVRPRSAELWSCGIAGVLFRGVLYRPAGAIFIMSYFGPTAARPASGTALRCVAGTIDSSTIPTGGSR